MKTVDRSREAVIPWVSAVCLVAFAAGAPLAAAPARSMAGLADRVKAGTNIDVQDSTGAVFRGELVRVDGEGVLLAAYRSGPGRRVPAADVMTVTRAGDPLWNGTAIGAGIGLAFGISLANGDDGTEAVCYDNGCKVGLTAATAGLFGGIGLLVDLLIKGREVVYDAPAGRVSWSVTPHPVPRGAGLRVAMRF